jgi:hypothetical protein
MSPLSRRISWTTPTHQQRLYVSETVGLDLDRVLHDIAETAGRVCGAVETRVFLVDGDQIHRRARVGALDDEGTAEPRPLRRDSVQGKAILDRTVVHIHDMEQIDWSELRPGRHRDGERPTVQRPEGSA